jgi:pyrroloquinoline quinone biosynthesis protein B
VRIHVLGSAAGGGFPQWNCGCVNCAGLRTGTIAATARRQAALAVSGHDGNWFLIHAAPDISSQVAAFSPLHPRGLRDSPIAGILLTNGDLDQCLGLLSLRELQPLHVYATEPVRRAFTTGNRLYRALRRMPCQITWHELTLYRSQALMGADQRPSTVVVTTIPVPGKVPLYADHHAKPQDGDNIALLIRDRSEGPLLAYAPCVGWYSPEVKGILEESDCLFFDGTFWSEDELMALGLGNKHACEMAHWPLAGANGSLPALEKSRPSRRILIHINNTNPILREDSPERRDTERAGVEVAYDGMELIL